MSEHFVILTTSAGDASIRREGKICSSVEEAVVERDRLRRASMQGRAMLQAARPTSVPSPRLYFIVGAISDEIELTDEERSHAQARATAMTAPRGAAPPAPVPLSKIAEGVEPFPKTERQDAG